MGGINSLDRFIVASIKVTPLAPQRRSSFFFFFFSAAKMKTFAATFLLMLSSVTALPLLEEDLEEKSTIYLTFDDGPGA